MGTGTSFDLKSKFPNDYMNFTIDNFIIGSSGFYSNCNNGNPHVNLGGSVGYGTTITKTYDQTNGILSIENIGGSNSIDSGKLSISGSLSSPFVYIIIGEIKGVL